MAKMYPSTPDPDTPTSEKQVFAILEEGLPKNWVVFHSRRLNIPTNRGLIEKEIDFVILDPDRGYIGLEVKGGVEIGRDQDGWYSVDHKGYTNRLSKDPGAQAQSAVHTLSRYLEGKREFSQTRYRYGWGVAFPGFSAGNFDDPSLSRQMVLGSEDLKDVKAGADRLFDVNGIDTNPLLPPLKNSFVQSLYPMVRLAASLADRIDADEPELVRLTQEQFDALDQLDDMKELVVKGGAGTGKTMLAMEKARRLVAENKRVLFLCFNKPLAEYLDTLAEGFIVRTFHQFCREMARAAGFKFNPPREFAASQAFWNEEAAELLDKALDALPDERYDAVIVDEGQDFSELWWLGVTKCRNDDSVFYVFMDPNQQVYERESDDLPAVLDLSTFKLKYNCRNTVNIAEYCGVAIGQDQKVRPGAPEGIEVEVDECLNAEEMIDLVRRHLHRLTAEEKIPAKDIVILTAGRTAVEKTAVWKAKRYGNISLVGLGTNPGPNEVVMTTIRRFKGLESNVVIVCNVSALEASSDVDQRELYVGFSRGRHVLVVLKYRFIEDEELKILMG
jgi:ATP:corrinoid adenosyltransferase